MARFIELPDPTDHAPIQGPRLRLRPLAPADLPMLMGWLADPEVQEFYGLPPKSLAEAHDIYLMAEDAPCWRFVIEDQGRPVGEIQYYHPYLNERWSAGIDLLIGEPGDRNRGVGTEAVRTLLHYLFETKGVSRVTIGPEPANHRAIHSYRKAGFQVDGVIRRADKVDERWVDAVHMTILDDEWPAAKARWEAETGHKDAD